MKNSRATRPAANSIDLLSFALVVTIISSGCAHHSQSIAAEPSKKNAEAQAAKISGSRLAIKNIPEIKTQEAQILLGGFSGLIIEDENSEHIIFSTITDRGPNSGLIKDQRPFAVPSFAPSIVQLKYFKKLKTVEYLKTLELTHADGSRVTGLPNQYGSEKPVTVTLQPLKPDPNGLDVEGLVRTQDGSIWVCDEYGPSVVKFSKDGVWQKRFVPKGTLIDGMINTVDLLPSSLSGKRTNRGFEAITTDGENIYAFMQSPLKKGAQDLHVVELNIKSEKVTGEYILLMQDKHVEKIGDAISLGHKKFLVIELDSLEGAQARKYLTLVDLKNATNIRSQSAGMAPAQMKRIITLPEVGFTYAQKAEGLAYSPTSQALYIVNDNDFGLNGKIDLKNKVFLRKDESSELFQINVDLTQYLKSE